MVRGLLKRVSPLRASASIFASIASSYEIERFRIFFFGCGEGFIGGIFSGRRCRRSSEADDDRSGTWFTKFSSLSRPEGVRARPLRRSPVGEGGCGASDLTRDVDPVLERPGELERALFFLPGDNFDPPGDLERTRFGGIVVFLEQCPSLLWLMI